VGALAGEAAQILREAGAQVVPPEDSEALADAIRQLAVDPQRRLEMGRHGRCYVEKYFDREMLAQQYRKLLESSGGQRRGCWSSAAAASWAATCSARRPAPVTRCWR
jgi:glycosyltransferase involved in cell wall biosynthesis